MIKRVLRHLNFWKSGQSGNVFFAIFGAVAMVGILGGAVMTFVNGPLTQSVKLNKVNVAENQMAIGAQVAVMAAAAQSGGGDCDSDGYVEPIQGRSPTTEPVPTGGWLVPHSLGMSKKDSWGTDYGYCIWNHGAMTSGAGCGTDMLEGANTNIYPVVAIVSAGPDRTFTTTCRSFTDADVNADGDLLDVGDLVLVSKAADTDDDIIFAYTYEEAVSASGGLWNLKSGEPTTAEISKNIEVGGDTTVSGLGTFSGGIILPDYTAISCDPSNSGVMARNASNSAIYICDGSSWQAITGNTGSTPGIMQLGTEDTITDGMCTASDVGLMRYNTSGQGDEINTTIDTSVTSGSANVTYIGTNTGSAGAPVSSGAAIVLQTTAAASGSSNSASQTFSSAPTVGNTVIVSVSSWSSTSACDVGTNMTVSDNHGNTYSKASSSYTWHAGWTHSPGIFYAPITSSGATFTVTATDSTCTDVYISLMEVVGLEAAPLDAFNNPYSPGEDYVVSYTATTSAATVQAAEFAVSVAADSYGAAMTAPPGWTSVTTNTDLSSAYTSLSSTGVQSATWGGSTSYKNAAIATFRVATLTPALIQSTSFNYGNSFNTSQTFSSPPSVGNTVVVLGNEYSGSSPCAPATDTTITDNYGNTYVSVVGSSVGPNALTAAGIWYANVATTGPAFTVTANSSACYAMNISLLEVSNLASSPVDATGVVNWVYSTSLNLSTSTATTQINEFAVLHATSLINQTYTGLSGWTELVNDGDFSAYRLLTSPGTVSTNISTPLSDDKTGVIATFKSSGVGTFAGSQTVSLSPPSGFVAGDLLVYAVSSDEGTSGDITWPAGFTELASQYMTDPDGQTWAVAYKIADGSETNLDVTDATTFGMVASLSAYRGANATTPISAFSSNYDTATTSSPWTLTGTTITPTVNGSRLVFIGSANPDSTASGTTGGTLSSTPPSGFVERVDLQGTNAYSGQSYLTVADMVQATAAATGSVTATLTSSAGGTARTGVILLSISPSATSASSASSSSSVGSFNSHVELCNGTEWVVMGRGALNDMADARTNYTGAISSTNSQSTYSMFLGLGSGDVVASGATNNTALGYNSLHSLTTGSNNTAMGYQALYTNTTGSGNSALGSGALFSNNTGGNNSALGYQALYSNVSGNYNSALGFMSLHANTASGNTGIGVGTLFSNVAKTGNTAAGWGAMTYTDNTATAGVGGNTAAGYLALFGVNPTPSSVTGTNSTAIGYQAGLNWTTGGNNVLFGYEAGSTFNGASNTVALGFQAGYTDRGGMNVSAGALALYSNCANQLSVAVGYGAMVNAANNCSGPYMTYNTAVGPGALVGSSTPSANTGRWNTAVGYQSMGASTITTASYNTCIGYFNCQGNVDSNTAIGAQVFQSNTSGAGSSVGIGTAALASQTSGEYNVAVGVLAAHEITSQGVVAVGFSAQQMMRGQSNTAVGFEAMKGSGTPSFNTGDTSVALGALSLYQVTTGYSNVAVGYSSLYSNTSGYYNVGVGSYAIYGTSGSGVNNTAIGYESLYSVANVGGHVSVGNQALRSVTNGVGNTAIGYQAGYAGTAIVSGSSNTFIGYQAQSNGSAYTNGMAIGSGSVLTASNRIVLGNTSISSIRAQVTSITGISDRRHKKDIIESDLGLSFINTLHPVSYRFNNGDDTLRYGLIAQEVEQSLPDKLKPLVHQDNDGLSLVTEDRGDKTYHVTYGEIISPLVKAVQDISRKIDLLIQKFDSYVADVGADISKLVNRKSDLEKQVLAREDRIKSLKGRVEKLEAMCDRNDEIGMVTP